MFRILESQAVGLEGTSSYLHSVLVSNLQVNGREGDRVSEENALSLWGVGAFSELKAEQKIR